MPRPKKYGMPSETDNGVHILHESQCVCSGGWIIGTGGYAKAVQLVDLDIVWEMAWLESPNVRMMLPLSTQKYSYSIASSPLYVTKVFSIIFRFNSPICFPNILGNCLILSGDWPRTCIAFAPQPTHFLTKQGSTSRPCGPWALNFFGLRLWTSSERNPETGNQICSVQCWART